MRDGRSTAPGNVARHGGEVGAASRVRARAPGRVNVIGDHTDYTGGFVLPCAIGYETRATAVRREDHILSVRSRGDRALFALDDRSMEATATHDWQDYVRGVIVELQRAGVVLCGADVCVEGTLPLGAGLSSSASFEAALALALLGIAGAMIDPVPLALLLQRAENGFTGTRCGIMDQFAVLNARAGAALFLDTRSLTAEHVPLPASLAIVICNSMIERHLAADGSFNERRAECERSLARLRSRWPELRDLRDVTMSLLERARDLLPAPLFDRCHHIVSENQRVVEFVQALRAGDVSRLGALMRASHESLRAAYAVSCAELDTLVRLADDLPGAIGARMTGAGFGGCTVNLVDRNHVDAFVARIGPAYARETGIVPETYLGVPVDGASLVRA